jgi:porphobilinogen synthase
MSNFPLLRMRRSRRTTWSRALVRETQLSAADLIWPVFVIEGENREEPMSAMPGISRITIDIAVRYAEKAASLGIACIALFPNVDPSRKTIACEEAWNPKSLVCRATRAIKDATPDIGVMLDVALDPYNALGHDGLVRNGVIRNDETVEALVKQSLCYADAGADILAPSAMMDGTVAAMRAALEAQGHHDVMILSYAAKYASGFYGPFRAAVGADRAFATAQAAQLPKDKKTYQLDPANTNEALREVALDLSEGADMVMVKPGMLFLDICQRVKDRFGVPTFAYQVSGEYAMIQAAAQSGWIDRDDAVAESLIAFKRAGCDGILTYFAFEVAEKRAKGELGHR